MNVSDLIITIAYFSIPVQILFSLWQYPRLSRMTTQIFILAILFALFIFMCGAGHLLRCLDRTGGEAFAVVNAMTAFISLVTALYLLPLTPMLMGSLDQSIEDLTILNKETNASKDKLFTFMAFLCHEIRNPLFAITSSASFLADTDMTEEQEIGVGSIFDSSLLMLRLVNDVLDLSKIDAGKLELEEKDFDLLRLLDNLKNTMKMQVAQKHCKKVGLRFDVAPSVPAVVHGDSVRLLQIIYNLISNSNKFTSEGEISLEISVTKELDPNDEEGEDNVNRRQQLDSSRGSSLRQLVGSSQGNSSRDVLDSQRSNRRTQKYSHRISWRKRRNSTENAVEGDSNPNNGDNTFSMALLAAEEGHNGDSEHRTSRYRRVLLSIVVTDTGIGIAPDRIEKIFEPYSQSKLSDYRKHGGTGLGLSILSSLTKLMGGHIHVESELGKGTKITCSLPIMALREENNVGGIIPSDIDMSDPFLSARRLPVFTNKSSSKGHHKSVSTSVHEDRLHHDDAGIRFFSPSEKKGTVSMISEEEGSGVGAETKKPELCGTQQAPSSPKAAATISSVSSGARAVIKKPPRLPPFNLPPGNLVLVVDDNSINRKIIGRMLTYFNLEYDEAENGVEALKLLRKRRDEQKESSSAPRYGLVFMDLSMPVMDGYDAIEALRQDGIDVPVIALTANALTRERDRALSLGADEFHTKPILRNDLRTICARYLDKDYRSDSSTPEALETDSSSETDAKDERILNSLGEPYREGLSLLQRHESTVKQR